MEDDKKSGPEVVAEMMNEMDPSMRDRIMNEISEKDRALFEKIKELMFTFEDILKLSPLQIQELVRKVPQQKLALSLRNASDELKNGLFENMSSRMKQAIIEEIESVGPQKLSKVQETQKEIVKIAKDLFNLN